MLPTREDPIDLQFLEVDSESGGVDTIVMHVQADGNSRIECYAENASDVQFVLLGYWEDVSDDLHFYCLATGSRSKL